MLVALKTTRDAAPLDAAARRGAAANGPFILVVALSLVPFVINKYTHATAMPDIARAYSRPFFFILSVIFRFPSLFFFFHQRVHRLQSLFRQEQFVKQKFDLGDVVGFCERRASVRDKSRVRLKEVDV